MSSWYGEDAFMSCEDRNYARDRRVRAKNRTVEPDHKHWHWALCDCCDGRGKVVNPSIDASGLTREDFDEDPDFAEGYMAGLYDITCPQCLGRTTMVVNDLTLKLAKETLAKIGVTIRHRADLGEYRVNLKDGVEATAYYSDDLEDAVSTGLTFAVERERG